MKITKLTTKTFTASILTLLVVVLFFAPIAQAETTTLSAKEVTALKETLNQQNKDNLEIQPMYQERISPDVINETPLTPSENGDYLLTRKNTVGLDPIPWLAGYSEETTIIEFNGISQPNATITLTVRSNPIIKIVHADNTGAWEINLDLNDVPGGSHTVYLQSESKDVKSDEIIIAKFVVLSRDTISNTTWMTVIVIGVGIILLLIAINIQFLYERRKADQYVAPPVAKEKDDVAPVTEELKKSITEAAEKTEQRNVSAEKDNDQEMYETK